MPILNEDVKFNLLPDGIRNPFVGKSARRVLLPAGHRLYKFSGYDIIAVTPDGRGTVGKPISPWWASVEPFPGTDDPGLDGHIAAAQAKNQTMLAYARQVFAVMYSWNTLSIPQSGFAKVLRIMLTQSVYGFMGHNQRMPDDIEGLHAQLGVRGTRPSLMGGAVQIWIPNLTAEYYTALGTSILP